jgi:hypothetical protein
MYGIVKLVRDKAHQLYSKSDSLYYIYDNDFALRLLRDSTVNFTLAISLWLQ